MRRIAFVVLTLLAGATVVAGCDRPADREAFEDVACRKIIAERHDTRPLAYQDCRSSLIGYGTTIINKGVE
jgi:hypothetical protein